MVSGKHIDVMLVIIDGLTHTKCILRLKDVSLIKKIGLYSSGSYVCVLKVINRIEKT